MFCINCGTALVADANFCASCGKPAQTPTSSIAPAKAEAPVRQLIDASPLELPSVAPIRLPLPGKPRWYDNPKTMVAIGVISFVVYANLGMATMTGHVMKGQDILYIPAWSAVVGFSQFKQRRWRGWLGAATGFAAGLMLVVLAAIIAPHFR